MTYIKYTQIRQDNYWRQMMKKIKNHKPRRTHWVPIPKPPTEEERRTEIIIEIYRISQSVYGYDWDDTPWSTSEISEFVNNHFGERRWDINELCTIPDINKFLNYEDSLYPDRFSDWLRLK